tara:strand:- start:166 stop:363 length:198 start_codon:yes stop_codon:yes gene_type:complete
MSNLSIFTIALTTVPYLWFTLLLTYPKATAEDQPIAYVEIVEEEIEIEYIRPPSQEEIERARNFE